MKMLKRESKIREGVRKFWGERRLVYMQVGLRQCCVICSGLFNTDGIVKDLNRRVAGRGGNERIDGMNCPRVENQLLLAYYIGISGSKFIREIQEGSVKD